MHPTKELGGYLVAFVNAQVAMDVYSMPFTAIYQPVPGMASTGQLGTGLRVVVSPVSWDRDWSTRDPENFADDIAMSIGVTQQLPAGMSWDSAEAATWIDARHELVAEIMNSLAFARDETNFPSYTGATPTNPILIDSASLVGQPHVFTSVIQITFTRNE